MIADTGMRGSVRRNDVVESSCRSMSLCAGLFICLYCPPRNPRPGKPFTHQAPAVPSHRVGSTVLGADAFALLSHSEGLPVAVLEAMAAALPVIITQDCNLPEVALHHAGEIVRGNIDEVAKALARVFDEPIRAKMMGLNGRQLVSERFTWARVARRTIQTYEQACAQIH